MSCNRLPECVLMLVCVSCMSAFAAIEATDFVDDAHANAERWELSGTEKDGYGRNFQNGGESITSPVYGGAVVSASVSAKTFSIGGGSALVIEARPAGAEDWTEVHRLVFANNSATNETFALPRADNYRQFRLSFVKGEGTMRVGSFAVEWRADGEVAVPSGLSAGSVEADSFIASWTIDEAVECFLFDCWRESMTPWTGDVKWAETFECCTNETRSSKRLTEEIFDMYTDHAGWSGDFVYAPEASKGVIQVNKASESVGWLVSPKLPAADSVEMVVRARAVADQPDHVMPVFLIRNGATNEIGSFELTTSFVDCHCHLQEVLAGDRLAFKSFSVGAKRRVLIDSVSLVEGFEPGHPETNYVFESEMVEYSEIPEFQVEGLIPGCEYAFSVRAVSGETTSEPSGVHKVVTAADGDVDVEVAWPGAVASEITHTSFRLDWPIVSGAATYRISVWTNALEGASAGRTVWSESFSKAMASSSTTAISGDAKFHENYADKEGWGIVSNVYPSVDSGTVRLGNTTKPGELTVAFGQLSEGCTLRVRARRQTSKDGAVFSVRKLVDGELSELGEACEIGEELTECVWTLPEMHADDRLVFRSASGKESCRTILDEVEILEGYLAGRPVPDYAVNGEAIAQPFYSALDMPSAVWTFAVEAVDASGRVLVAATNKVDLVDPPPQPVLDAVLLSESSHKGGMYIWQEDFGAFTNVFPSKDNTADWLNGTTLPHWQAYAGGVPVTGITRNNGAGTKKGLYAYWATNGLASTYSLGVMMTGTAEELIYGLAFKNDTPFSARKISVNYDGVQFGFKNNAQQELLCECLVTNELVALSVEGDWRSCDELTFRTSRDSESGLKSGEDLPVVTAISSDVVGMIVPKDFYFMIRWRRTAVVSAAAMAIDNVVVSFEVQSRPMRVVVR